MSPLLDSMESEWHAQLRSMREAIAELKLDQQQIGHSQGYGHEINIDDGDITGRSESDDIWDVWSDEEETEESSDFAEGLGEELKAVQWAYDEGWLQSRCVSLANGRSGLDATQLMEQISTLLASDMQGKTFAPQGTDLSLQSLQRMNYRCLLPKS